MGWSRTVFFFLPDLPSRTLALAPLMLAGATVGLSTVSLATLAGLKAHGAPTADQLSSLVVALKPDKNPDQLLKERHSLEAELTRALRALGQRTQVKVIVPTSSAVILQGFANGTVDVGYLSSLDMVNAEKAKAANLLLAGRIKGQTHYQSYWVVRSDSKFQSIADLKGRPVAFASRTSTSGYLIPYWDLIKSKRLRFRQDPEAFFGKGNVFYGTGYVSAVQRVLDGTADAAAVSDYVMDKDKHLNSEQKKALRVLQSQGPVPTHVIAGRSGLTQSQRELITRALESVGAKNPHLRDQVFTSELVPVDPTAHLASTREALELTGFGLN